jgi:hypothetical protein
MTEGLVVALLISFLADAVFPRRLESSNQHSLGMARLPEIGNTTAEERRAVARQRLTEGKAVLDQLDRERESQGDSDFRKTTEDRIIWGELLDLELQDFDEQLNRIRQTAGEPPRPRSPSG